MTPEVAITVFSIFALITGFWLAYRVDMFFGLVYGMLFVYSIFAQYGYCFRPDLSMQIHAYFGEYVFDVYYWLVLLSFVFLFILCVGLGPLIIRGVRYPVVFRPVPLTKRIFLIYSLFHWGFLTAMLSMRGAEMSYASASSEEFANDRLLMITGVLFKLMVPDLLIWWHILREGIWSKRFWIIALLGQIVFALYCVRLGNRTDIVALFLGIALYELVRARSEKRVLFRGLVLCAVGGIVLWGAFIVDRIRSNDSEEKPLEDRILLNDYYAPSHMLFAAISYDFVNPGEVVRSNFNNALVLRGYPYLHATVTDLFRPGVATRSQGYAFYLFTEGYIVAGRYGFIYNGIVVFMGIVLWRTLALSNHMQYNRFVLMILASMAANIARGQSVYFIKYGYMYYAPALILFYIAAGLRPSFSSRKRGSGVCSERIRLASGT